MPRKPTGSSGKLSTEGDVRAHHKISGRSEREGVRVKCLRDCFGVPADTASEVTNAYSQEESFRYGTSQIGLPVSRNETGRLGKGHCDDVDVSSSSPTHPGLIRPGQSCSEGDDLRLEATERSELVLRVRGLPRLINAVLPNCFRLSVSGSRSASETMGDKLHRREGNSPDHQLRPLNDRSVIKEVGVQRQPGGSSTEGESGPKIRPKGVVDGQQVNIPVLPLVGPEGRRRLGEPATEAPVNGGRNYNGPKRLGEIDMSVKMRTTCTWTERPYEASLFPGIGFGLFLRSLGGRRRRPPSGGASQKVTEACKGFLGPDGDWPSSAKAEGSLTARPTRRAGTKVGLTHIDGKVWHLDVGSSPPGAVVCSKGWAVRPLKRPPQDECSPIPTSPEPPVAQPRQRRVLCPCGDGATEVLRIQEKVTARRAVYHYDRDGRAESFGVPPSQELGPRNHYFLSCLSSFMVRYSGVLGVEEPHQSIPNLVVKLYCGDDTVGEVLRKNSSTPG
ncbi:hypothetical protein Tco_0210615 [Tanacetum coccineum]